MISSGITAAAANIWKTGGGGGSLLLTSCRQLKPNASSISYLCSSLHGVPPGTSSRSRLHLFPAECSKRLPASVTARRLLCVASSSSSVADSSSADPTSSSPQGSSAVEDVEAMKNAANTLDLRVGKILRAWRHEEADSLYVEEVDVGEPAPRIICSGLVKYIPIEHLQDKKVIVLANLKPRNMRGVKSFGMLMAASDASRENIELLVPPEDSLPGGRVWFGSADEKDKLPDVATANQVQKKKIWEQVQPYLRTDSACAAVLVTHFMRTSDGKVVSSSIKNGNIS